ncbi:MAG TPA: NADPH-dependent assimilatory sulfite reductase hemoprotein subunit [Opitutaceae bacterium]|nr:NADPH-dependent assimilatory sulfite reductase hemoprotein subunit [Opitutaceae bacterium]
MSTTTTGDTTAAAPKLSKNELLKEASPALSGQIAQTLAEASADHFNEDDEQFLKFHGIYQQDDRDKRKTGKQYLFMIRARIPGGVVPAAQYLVFDELAARHGNTTLRVTTRQTFQWHGVVKSGLGAVMRGIHEALASTIASCGDVVRNVIAPSTPSLSPLAPQVYAHAAWLSDELAPKRTAYHEIWLDGAELNLPRATKLETRNAKPETATAEPEVDPLYGRTYLPRKFKIGFAIPPLNDTDIFANCLGFVAIADPADPSRLLGYNLLAGGGMGMSHGNAATYPRVADIIGFLPAERVLDAARAVVTIHRDFGDRTNRKHARLKYVLAERGVEWFREEFAKRAGFALEAAKEFQFTRQTDLHGWHDQGDGKRFLGLYVEAGRIKDQPGHTLRTALRTVVERYRPEVRLTAQQNVILAGIRAEDEAAVTALFAEHGIDLAHQGSSFRKAALACVALPTCGLALAEAERVLSQAIERIEALLAEVGIGDEEIIFRITGCPNGCARPYLSEFALVGRAPGKYNLYLGGDHLGMRLNRLHKESVKFDDVVAELRPLFQRFVAERQPGERFGDFTNRAVLG